MIPLTPYMLLVLAGFGLFIGVLGVTWFSEFIKSRR